MIIIIIIIRIRKFFFFFFFWCSRDHETFVKSDRDWEEVDKIERRRKER